MSTLHIDQGAGVLGLRVEGSLTITEVTPMKQALLSALDDAARPHLPVVLDIAAVTDADSAGVQLLTSTARWLAARRVPSTVSGESGALELVARAVGAADARQCCGFTRQILAGGQA